MTAFPTPRSEHPDPGWWKRSPLVAMSQQSVGDLCDECGHTRDLHNSMGGCRARSAALFGSPLPCLCTRSASVGSTVAAYHRPMVVDRPRS